VRVGVSYVYGCCVCIVCEVRVGCVVCVLCVYVCGEVEKTGYKLFVLTLCAYELDRNHGESFIRETSIAN